MKIWLLTVLLAVHATLSLQGPISKEVLNITLYYEPLCGGCAQFTTKQLGPVYNQIGDNLLIDLNPYGFTKRTEVNGKWVYECTFGPDKCVINKIEACGLAKSTDPNKQVAFVSCVEKLAREYYDNYEKLAACGDIVGSGKDEILECAQGPEGDELFGKLAEKQSHAEPIKYVPWITLNGKHDEDFEDDARKNFLQAVCKRLNDMFSHVPKACSKIN